MEKLIHLIEQGSYTELQNHIAEFTEEERQNLLVEIIDEYYRQDKFLEYKKAFEIIIGSKLNLNFNIKDHWATTLLSLVILRVPYINIFDYFVGKGADINFIGDSYAFDDEKTIKKEVADDLCERYETCLDFINGKLSDIFQIDYNYIVPEKKIEGHWTEYKDGDTITIEKSDYLYLHEQAVFLHDLIYTDKLRDHILDCGAKTYREIEKLSYNYKLKPKTIKTKQGKFIYTRNDFVTEFHCDRCNQIKKSKIIIKWTDTNSKEKTICNACFGNLLSKQ